MSDLSIIAHDYALNAEFARRFNDAVLTLKRAFLLHRTATAGDEGRVKSASMELNQLLTSLVLALEDSSQHWSQGQARVPADVVEGLRIRKKGELPELITELRATVKELANGCALQKPSFNPLDFVCEAADATASAAFRRLRRI